MHPYEATQVVRRRPGNRKGEAEPALSAGMRSAGTTSWTSS